MTLLGGRYRLEGTLGRGGTGEVHRALDERLDRRVAVKLLHPWAAEDDETRRRFRREATTLAQLRHPNIVQVLDFDDGLEQPFLVQELCAGGTLVARTSEAPLPWDEVAAIGLPIARGLAHAHASGVTHRDLKPGNVLYGDDGQLRIVDFGLADVLRRSREEEDITGEGVRVGSPEYWSPEQAAGLQATERADIYALGCILYELATGALPFEGPDRIEVGMRRMHEDPPSPRALAPDLPPQAETLLLEMLQRAPERRPRAQDVARILAGDAPIEPQADEAQTTRMPAGDVPPTMVAEEPRVRLGVRTGALRVIGLITAVALVLIGIGVAAGAQVGRTGIRHDPPLGFISASAALSVAVGVAVFALVLAIFALWATRNRERALHLPSRIALSVLAVVAAALCAALIVWTAHAWLGLEAGLLWRELT